MIRLYDKTYTIEYGTFDTLVEAFVEEERNGLFELSFIVLNTDNLFNYIKEENIVVTDANDTLLNQKFRIYMTRKLMNNRVEVFARHISFDLMYDYIDNLSFTNQSCQYALNQLFINSNFSKHYKGYSNIVNAQNYKMSMANILEAIGGKSGSIIDVFGNGAELLRDNENIHVLNRRGNDNEVTIEYRKNLIGFELEEDTTDLVTKILPYAKYNDEETSEEITVKADFIDSPLINNYSHPYIKTIDYSEKFEEGEIPTVEKLITFAKNEYKNNKVDIPKQNFKIDFIPLSKCVGYEGLEDKISLCDTVTIVDTRYNINTQAKVIKTVFNVLKNRYESIELGEPKTSLGDIIGSGGNDEPVVGPPGPPGPPGQDGNLGDFPNSLPATPILESFVYGFSNIELTWSFENKIYYQYELYASKVKDFIPNTFDLIFQGQASSYMFQAKPNETWHFKVCGINTYGERTQFSNQVTVTTTKIEDLSNYVENMAIGEALIGKLSLDRGWIGKLNANLLDVKGNFSVTDGNGKRTLDIDSFGNVNLDVTSLKISSKGVATQDYTNNVVDSAKNEAINSSKVYTDTQIELTNDVISLKASKTELTSTKNEVIKTANSYTDNAKNEVIDTSKIYTDNAKNEAINNTKNYTDKAKEEAINNSNNYTDTVKKELYASIEISADKISQAVVEVEGVANTALNKASSVEQTASSITSTVTSLNNKYTEIKQTVDSIDLTGKVSFSDLSTKGGTVINGANISTGTITADKLKTGTITSNEIATGTITANDIASNTITADKIATSAITADKIATGTITVDKISSNNANPIIKLFNNCAIDATKLNEQGKGTAIRLKMDAENYIKISQSNYNQNGDYVGAHTAIFSSLYPNHEVMMFQGNAHWGKIWTTQGIISTHGDNVYYGNNGDTTDKRLLNSSNLSNSVSSTGSTVATSNAVKQAYDKAVQAYNIGNHSHPYASSSHSHSDYMPKASTTYFESGSHDPYYTDSYNLGWSSYRWQQLSSKYVYATNTYSSAIDNPVSTVADNSIDNVLDDIVIESPNVMRMSDKEALNEKLVINVNSLKENENAHLFVNADDGGNVVVNESSLLALALLEIQKLKQEIKNMKEGVSDA